MSYASDIGFIASALVLAAFGMKDMINLRVVAMCSNVAFIAYALVLNLLPILVLHVILLPLNGWRLAQALQYSPRQFWGWRSLPDTDVALLGGLWGWGS
jgi:CRP/FNR family transcriptional regulator, cyclic AMP receptor protein